MAKAIAAYEGSDSVGRMVEVAQREDGVFFSRQYGWNGYGNVWSKWIETEVTFQTHGTNVYSGEQYEHEVPKMSWGFKTLQKMKETPRFRLPNAAKAA